MAKATSITTEMPVTKTITTYEYRKIITLELSVQEAQALRMVCSLVGGDPETSSRKYINAIRDALDKEGTVEEIYPLCPTYCEYGAGIYFRDKV